MAVVNLKPTSPWQTFVIKPVNVGLHKGKPIVL